MLTKDPKCRPSIHAVLASPAVRPRLSDFVSENAVQKPIRVTRSAQRAVKRTQLEPSASDSFVRAQQANAPCWAQPNGAEERLPRRAHPASNLRGSASTVARSNIVLIPARHVSDADSPKAIRPVLQIREDDSLRKIELQRCQIENNRLRMRALELGLRLPGRDAVYAKARAEVEADPRVRRLEREAQTRMRPDGGDEETVAQARDHLHRIRSLAKSIRESMAEDGAPDDNESFEGQEDRLANGLLAGFPVVKDEDSLAYRAEAIRAFLEKEIGLERLLALQQDLLDQGTNPFTMSSQALQPRIVSLAQQLLILDERIAQS
jgi:hypothetical protein